MSDDTPVPPLAPVVPVSPRTTSSTDMWCACCGQPTGEEPWYVLDLECNSLMLGPLCESCARIYYPGSREIRE